MSDFLFLLLVLVYLFIYLFIFRGMSVKLLIAKNIYHVK